MKKAFLLVIFLYSLTFYTFGRTAMGQWQTHFAYNSVTKIAQSENKIFAVASGALFSVDKNDRTYTLYDKINGLSDNVISQIEYDNINKQLIVAYNNGNIDLISEKGIVNIPDYYNINMSINKNINHITIHNNKAYLSCNFGILVLNLKRKEIAESYYIAPNAQEVIVSNTTINNGNIYAVTYTESGSGENIIRDYEIFYASLSNSNLVNYENWTTMSDLPGNGNIQTMLSFNNSLFLLRDNVLYKQQADEVWNNFENIHANTFSVSNGKMVIYVDYHNAIFVDENSNVNYNSSIGVFNHVEYDPKNSTYWFGGLYEGVKYYQDGKAGGFYIPNGPDSNNSFDMTFLGERLFVMPGGRNVAGAQYSRPGVVMVYENGRWNNTVITVGNNPVGDFMKLTIDPKDETHYFITSYGTGLYEFRNNVLVNWYSVENTAGILESADKIRPLEYTRLAGGVFDSEGNFWFANSSSMQGVKVFQPTGNLMSLSCRGIDTHETVGNILINKLNPNHKWILAERSGGGIGILDDGGTVNDPQDDESNFYSSFPDSDPNKQGEYVSPKNYYCIAQEKNGTIWVGTNMGPLLFQRPNEVLKGREPVCTRIKIPKNDGSGLADLLLENEHIMSIAIDAANRKWIGTQSSGVFLVSENGQETIHHFTAANSPLLSDQILSIAINPLTGEVFLATANGLISYQGDAAESDGIFDNIHVYPNPVRQNFAGVITIAGLIENTQVKITDLNGNLVCETRSNGSLATWNGLDTTGRKVATGVYLALCVSEDGKQRSIAKILIIN